MKIEMNRYHLSKILVLLIALVGSSIQSLGQTIPAADDDASISFVSEPSGLICGHDIYVEVVLTNAGTNPLTSTTIQVERNGTVVQTMNWTGNLAPGVDATITVSAIQPMNGTNTIVVSTSLPNGITDSDPSNDSFTVQVEASPQGHDYSFALTTDDYPGETTWTLAQNGTTIYSGGPYSEDNTLHTESFCLDSGYCYMFTINDEYGDGICCGYGHGGYTFHDGSGNLVIEGGEFDDLEIREFCIGLTLCELTADAVVVNESGPGTLDGSITITAIDGTPPYEYSIDGGTTFQSSGMFPGLGVGFYSIKVSDDNDCDHSQTVAIAVISGINELAKSGIEVYPNPTSGEFSLKISNQGSWLDDLNIEVMDAKGRQVQRLRMAGENGTYQSTISLVENAPGVYYIRLLEGNQNKLIRVVKE